RNTLLIQLTVIFAIASVLLVPRLLLPLFSVWPELADHSWLSMKLGNLRWLTVIVFIIAVASIAGNQMRLSGKRRFRWGASWMYGFPVGLVLIVATLCYVESQNIDLFANSRTSLAEAFKILCIAVALVVGGCFLVPTLVRGFNWLRERRRPGHVDAEVDYT